MSIFWQNMIIGAAIAIAVVYVVDYEIRKRRKRAACASCQVLKAVEKRPQDRSGAESDNKDSTGLSKI